MFNEEKQVQCLYCEQYFHSCEINEDGLCTECNEKDKVQCSDCEKYFFPNEIGHDGLCAKCHELDSTPTSEECDNCDGIAIKNICGTNLCEDCLEHYHY